MSLYLCRKMLARSPGGGETARGGEHGRGRRAMETEGAVLAVARAVLFLYTTVVNKLPWHFFRFLMICAVSCVWFF